MLIRPCAPEDVAAVFDLVRGLARYERAEHEVASSPDHFTAALFGAGAFVHCDVAEDEGVVVGFALWFLNFSTWTGRPGVYLEDLYVDPARRGRGAGLALLRGIARRCVENDWARFEWSVLDWNEPAIEFYRRVGAVAQDEWTRYRLDGEALAAFAEGSARP